MRRYPTGFRNIVAELAEMNAAREQLMLKAFTMLERQNSSIADLLLLNVGSRQRAVRWMCMSQRALGGRCAYEALADGDVDGLWDLITGEDRPSELPGASARYAAY